ncbi:LysR family transcriptional regulator [Xanthomonas citri pv. phaseoli var. fuscans]|uniref:Transcriptional regulator n=1 Tax=Xanthomonas campestris pv. phaseoli TaxID=317013 RepID=A0A7Z7J4V3_XANCH
MLGLGALESFVATADTGSFTQASRRLGLSPSAVSKAVLRLESELQTRLFHRSTRSVALTPEGRLLPDRCRRIAAELEAAKQDLASLRASPRGRLKLGFPSAALPFIPKLARFQDLYPEIHLDMVCTDSTIDVIDEGFDIVFRAGEPIDSRLAMREVCGYRHVVIASPDYLARSPSLKSPNDLCHH